MLTPAEILELEDAVRERGLTGLIDPQEDALTALADALLRAVGAPRQPVRISKARLAEIEALCLAGDPDRPVPVDAMNMVRMVHFYRDSPRWHRRHMCMIDGAWQWHQSHSHPSLRAALEWPVVTRSDAGPVKWFEVEQ